MKSLDRISGIILFLLGLGICLKSVTYPVGSFKAPGGGLFPLLISIILMGLSGLMTIQTFGEKDKWEALKGSFIPRKDSYRKIFIGVIAMLSFRYLLPVIGFALSSFIFIFFVATFLSKYRWNVSLLFSVLTTLVFYSLFQLWLKVPMPQTIFGF